MARRQRFSLDQISPADWEKTPKAVQQLVLSLIDSTDESDTGPVVAESRLAQFLDATPMGIAVHEVTGRLIYLNQVGRSLLGIGDLSAIDIDLSQLSAFFQIYQVSTQQPYPVAALPSTRALTGEVAWADDVEIHQATRVIPLEVWATPIFDDQGQVQYAIAAFQDISDRKRLEAEQRQRELERQIVENTLRNRERCYRQVIQAQTDLILRSRPDTTITFANEALCLALGRPLEEILGTQWSDFVPPDEMEPIYAKIAALTPEQPMFENINQDQRANQQMGWTQWISLGIFDEQGQLVEIQSVGRDITALKEKILREQALNRVFQAIRQSLDLEIIFATATAETARLLKNLDCMVVQYFPEQGVWRHIAGYRHQADASAVIGLEISDTDNPFAAQLKQLQIVQVNDTSDLTDDINRGVAQVIPGAWLLIPLVVEGQLWGSFTITTNEYPFLWNTEQVELAQAVADQLAIAIQQANLYRQLRLELAERRRVEEALRESEARFQNMAANVPGAIFRYLLRPDGTDSVLYMSPGCYSLWEVDAQTVIDDASILWQVIHPEDLDAMFASVMVSAQTLQPWSHSWRITTPSGYEKWLEAAGRPQRQPNGDVIWDTLILDVSARKQAEIALQRSERRFRRLFESTPQIAVQGYNRDRQVIYWNQASEILYGYTKAEALGQQLEDLIIPLEMRQEVIAAVRGWVVEGHPIPAGELSLLRKDGSRVAVYSSHMMLINADGEPEMYCVDIDLSDRKQAEEALRESETRYRLLAENMNDLVCLHDRQGRYLYVSPSCEALLGYRYDELLGQDPDDFLHPDDRDRIYEEAQAAVLAGKATPITYRIRHKSGHYIWFETLTKPILDARGTIIQLQTTSRDVTERVQVQKQLEHDALHDALTQLPNRQLLMERLELAMNRAKRFNHYHFAVLFLDLDRFKVINDSLGHLAGDHLLVTIAQRLQAALRSIDLVARLGGDEFVILLEDIQNMQEAIHATERIFTVFQTPLLLEGREVYTTASIGIVLGNPDYCTPSELLRDADIAMYRAKNKGRAQYEIFDAEMYTQALNQLHLENDLRRAIAQQEFVLYYQPIVALKTGQIIGFEALIRWQHPNQGLKLPGDFITVAEETGLITTLDYWALGAACQQLVTWQRVFPNLPSLKVSVNLSAQDLRQPDLLAEVDRVLAQTGLAGHHLTLELTESMLIEDVTATITLLSQIKTRGIQLSIDDFGTGYSSLNYLHRLPIDYLKVDRSFVNQIQGEVGNHQIVATIATLSQQLGLTAIAEGIESQVQLEQLQRLGYQFGQGYFFAKPLSPTAVAAVLGAL